MKNKIDCPVVNHVMKPGPKSGCQPKFGQDFSKKQKLACLKRNSTFKDMTDRQTDRHTHPPQKKKKKKHVEQLLDSH